MTGENNTSAGRRWRFLVALSAAFCLFYLLVFARAPVKDGDSFEYAGVARNILETGTLREDLLRSYTIPGQPLPHPPAVRANLYVYFLVPFYAVFRETQWTFLVPAFLGIFLLPLIVYRAGSRLLGADAAFYAALLSLFCPSLLRLYSFMDPGLPEVWQMIFYLLFVLVMVEERYVAAGLLMGIAFLFKRNSFVLIPSALAWMAVYRRKHLFGLPVVKIFGVAMLLVLPFLVRSYIVFGNPFYTEQFSGLSEAYGPNGRPLQERFDEGDLFGIIFNYDYYNNVPAGEDAPLGVKAANFMRVVRTNARMAFLGSSTTIFYIPGMLQAMGLLMIPFFIAGCFSARGMPVSGLIFITLGFQLALHTVMAFYSDRYLLCVLPLFFLVAGLGIHAVNRWWVEGFGGDPRRKPATALLVFFLFTETFGFAVMGIARLMQSKERTDVHELQTVCSRLREETPRDTVIMTYPFFSTHFFCDRPTVPIPYGDLGTVAEAAKEYGVKYLVYTRVWPGDRFPEPPFASTFVRGRHLSLFEVDHAALDAFLADPGGNYMEKLNPIGYFLSGRFSFEMFPPMYKLAVRYGGGYAAGILIYIGVALLFVYLFSGRGRFFRWFSLVVMLVAVLAAQGVYIEEMFGPMKNAMPQVSRVQAEYLVKTLPEKKREIVMVAETSKNAPRVRDELAPLFRNAVTVPVMPEMLTPNTSAFIPVPCENSLLVDDLEILENAEAHEMCAAKSREIADKYSGKGYTATEITGGVLVY